MRQKKVEKKWDKEQVLKRLMRIADEAQAATYTENGKSGAIEYDVRCASIELKAVEFAVKLSGMLDEDKDCEKELFVVMSKEAADFAK